MNLDSKIYVAGHRGLVGSAILRALQREGYDNLVTASSRAVDLRDHDEVHKLFSETRPEYVFMAAAVVGGIGRNDALPAHMIVDNLLMEVNVLSCAYAYGVKKLMFLGSSCIYPKHAANPIKPDALMTGPLEPTNSAYAIAKIAGIEMCNAYRKQFNANFVSVMPTNVYGPGDCYDLERCHVMPAMIRRFHDAKMRGDASVELWGHGNVCREFIYSDDLADACLIAMKKWDDPMPLNIGVGEDITLRDLAVKVAKIVGFEGKIIWDSSKPSGTPRKLMDSSRMRALGWHPLMPLDLGIRRAYSSFKYTAWNAWRK